MDDHVFEPLKDEQPLRQPIGQEASVHPATAVAPRNAIDISFNDNLDSNHKSFLEAPEKMAENSIGMLNKNNIPSEPSIDRFKEQKQRCSC